MIKEQILTYIKEAGDEVAAAFFNKPTSTVRSWVRNRNVPGEAYETFLAGTPDTKGETAATEEILDSAMPDPSFNDAVIGEINSLRTRVQAIEDYLQASNNVAQPVMEQTRPTAAWYPADPSTQGFSSAVRPGNTVATKATFGVPAPAITTVKAAPLPAGAGMSDSWLKPRALK